MSDFFNGGFVEQGPEYTNETEVKTCYVSKRRWARDDEYEVVEVQVFNFAPGQRVRVTIEAIPEEGETEVKPRGKAVRQVISDL